MGQVEKKQLPAEFLSRLQSIVSPELYAKTLRSFENKPVTCFRVNQIVDPGFESIDQLQQQGVVVQQVPDYSEGYFVDLKYRESLTRSDCAANGQIYIQNVSSMLVVDVLDPQPGEQVLDLAAAPGGKTLLIAERMQGEGYLAAVEAVRKRFFKLQANLKMHSADWVKTFMSDGRSVGQKTWERFDRVLLDAPCSSEARFHIDTPESWQNWSPRKIRESSRKQNGLIRSAFRALKPGGTLVYCTCSFAPEENEQTVDHLLKKFPGDAELLSFELTAGTTQPGLTGFSDREYDPSLSKSRRIIPDEIFNGMFVTKITKLNSLGDQNKNASSHGKQKRRR